MTVLPRDAPDIGWAVPRTEFVSTTPRAKVPDGGSAPSGYRPGRRHSAGFRRRARDRLLTGLRQLHRRSQRYGEYCECREWGRWSRLERVARASASCATVIPFDAASADSFAVASKFFSKLPACHCG